MVETTFPVQVLLGIYLGLVTGIVPALVAWGLGFTFKYLTGVTIPGFGVVVLALAIAGVNGGLLAVTDPTITASENGTALVVAILVVLGLALYAHAKGDQMGAETPRRVSLRKLTERTLSADVVDLVGGRGQVRVRVAGDVADVEGYPPLPGELRREITEAELTFPADLPLAELESRVADRLRADFDLADVSVRLDERARATVAAAPPLGSLSKRVPSGMRAVSVSALVPTGLARGDEVTVVVDPAGSAAGDAVDAPGRTGEPAAAGRDGEHGDGESSTPRSVDGTVVSVRSGESGVSSRPAATTASTGDDDGDGDEVEPAPAPTAPTATGGRGRLTVAVPRSEATTLVARDADRVAVRSRGERREFELVSVLRRAGKLFRKVTVREDGALDGTSLREASVRDSYDVAVLAVRTEDRWRLAPEGSLTPAAGDELYAVGTRGALDAFQEAVA